MKQNVPINFAQGINTKTDEWQLPVGQFASLQNTIFQTGGLLQKRPGYAALPSLPGSANYITTFSDSVLTAVGQSIYAYSPDRGAWNTQGSIQPCSLSVQPLIRNSLNQTQVDAVVAANGLACVVYTETDGTNTYYKYMICDSQTGLINGAPRLIPGGAGVVTGSPRAFLLGTLFVIVFTNNFSSNYHIQYFSINSTNLSATSPTDITTGYNYASTLTWDGIAVGTNLYFSYVITASSGTLKTTYLTAANAATGGAPVAAMTLATSISTMTPLTICADTSVTTPLIYTIIGHSNDLCMAATDESLNICIPFQTDFVSMGTAANANLTAIASNGVLTIYSEVANNYSFGPGTYPSHLIAYYSVITQQFSSVFSSGASTITASSATGLTSGMTLFDGTTQANITAGTTFTISGTTLTLSQNTTGNSAATPGDSMLAVNFGSGTGATLIRSVGLASKAFIIGNTTYLLTAFQSALQSTYFLIDATDTTQTAPIVVAKLAYQNGGGYLVGFLPNTSVSGVQVQLPYLFKDFIEAVSTQNTTTQTQIGGVYSQTGINLGTFNLSLSNTTAVQIAQGLQIGGGFGWTYDGAIPVENNFFLFPDNIEAAWSTSGGWIAAQPDGSTNAKAYAYQCVYEWSDNQGNIYYSTPSVPFFVTTTGSGTSGSITVNIPTLRLTYKTTDVKLTIYRWSVANQSYFQTSSISSPTLNSMTTDSIAFVDTNADTSIVGKNLLYTTGGVVPDVNPPATGIMTLFDTRAWAVSAEDTNTLWVSKQVVEATPVEWSLDFTIYVAPNIGTTASTGGITSLFPMDDKLIIFKNNAIYYINGVGPDNLGTTAIGCSLGNYSQPMFVTAVVGCTNPQSIVLMQDGLMFQSDKGIWLLGRDLSTKYIGAPVEAFNGYTVNSAQVIPETNYILFTLAGTATFLMYDYFYGQWGTFVGNEAVASCIYQDLHTIVTNSGSVLQQTPLAYLDGGTPVLISFTTGWINLASLQGYERFYEMYLLAKYLSPHSIQLQVAYDYEPTIANSATVTPSGLTVNQREQWRLHAKRQLCEAFQLTVSEIYGGTPGAGFTMSGIQALVKLKSGARPIPAATSAGFG